jgi:hypothetical protein
MAEFVGMAAAAVSAAASLAQGIGGLIQKKNAEREAEKSAQRAKGIINQDVVNPYVGLNAPTAEYDKTKEETAAFANKQTEALSDAGSAAVIGGTGALVGGVHEANLETAAKIGEAKHTQETEVAEFDAAQAQRKQDALLSLEFGNLKGAQAAAMQGQQTLQTGLMGLTSSATSFGTEYMRSQGLYGGDEE